MVAGNEFRRRMRLQEVVNIFGDEKPHWVHNNFLCVKTANKNNNFFCVKTANKITQIEYQGKNNKSRRKNILKFTQVVAPIRMKTRQDKGT